MLFIQNIFFLARQQHSIFRLNVFLAIFPIFGALFKKFLHVFSLALSLIRSLPLALSSPCIADTLTPIVGGH